MAVEQGDVYFTVHRGPTSPKPGLKSSRARKKRKLPRAILDRVIRGIHASPRATAEMKALIGLPPPPAAVAARDLREIKISVK